MAKAALGARAGALPVVSRTGGGDVARALLSENPNPTEDEVRLYMAGNLCRCTGYQKIVDAILAASRGEVRLDTPNLVFTPRADEEEAEDLSLGTFRLSE